MARGREQHIEHLLRRAAFGAVEEEVDALRRDALRRGRRSPAQLRAISRRRRRQDRHPGLRRRHRARRRRLPAADQHQRRAAALAVPHGAQSSARCRRRWRSSGTTTSPPPTSKITGALGAAEATRMLAAKPSEDPARRRRTARAVPRARARQLPRSARRGREGSGDARLARRPHERPRPAAGELRARADGAVHDGRRHVRRRPTSTPARASSPAGTWRGRRNDTLLRVQLQRRPARHRRRRSSRSRSTRTAAGRFRRASAAPGHAGRHRSDQRRRAASGDRPAARAQALSASSSTRSTRRTRR